MQEEKEEEMTTEERKDVIGLLHNKRFETYPEAKLYVIKKSQQRRLRELKKENNIQL